MLNFTDFYDSYAAEVYRFAHWLTNDRWEAEDITSETFIRAWVRINAIRTESLKAYLFAIARNIYLQKHRKGDRQVALHDSFPDPAPHPDKKLESEQMLFLVQKVLQTLPEIDRAAFVLRVQHELPYTEIARVLELSVTASKVKVHRVRKKLLAACTDEEVY
jgi:RNA polymerase sigma-70 factor (ECF subfamily)